MNLPKKIAYITETDPDDKHAWSGTAHYVYASLKKQGHTVYTLGPAQPVLIGFFCKIINQVSLKLLKKRFDYRHSVIYAKAFGRIFNRRLNRLDHDLVVVCGGTEYAAYLNTPKPFYIIVDRTIQGAINYHPILTELLPFSQRQSIYTDKKAMLQSAKTFFASDWAAAHARKFYQLPDHKSAVLPFGANLDQVPSKQTVLESDRGKQCRLLFIGTKWENKGADIALNALNMLVQQGLDAHLTIVGCTPPVPIQNPNLIIIPFVNKNTAEGLANMEALYLSHHFFILPTRFEAYGIVFCEASAYGLISLAPDTGGISTVVREDINGFLMPHDDLAGISYAKKITELFHDKAAMLRLSASARDLYEQTLNWDAWQKGFEKNVTV